MNVSVSQLSPQPGHAVAYLVLGDPPAGCDQRGVHVVCVFEDPGDAERAAREWGQHGYCDALVVPVMLCAAGTGVT